MICIHSLQSDEGRRNPRSHLTTAAVVYSAILIKILFSAWRSSTLIPEVTKVHCSCVKGLTWHPLRPREYDNRFFVFPFSFLPPPPPLPPSVRSSTNGIDHVVHHAVVLALYYCSADTKCYHQCPTADLTMRVNERTTTTTTSKQASKAARVAPNGPMLETLDLSSPSCCQVKAERDWHSQYLQWTNANDLLLILLLRTLMGSIVIVGSGGDKWKLLLTRLESWTWATPGTCPLGRPIGILRVSPLMTSRFVYY